MLYIKKTLKSHVKINLNISFLFVFVILLALVFVLLVFIFVVVFYKLFGGSRIGVEGLIRGMFTCKFSTESEIHPGVNLTLPMVKALFVVTC